MKKLRKYFIPVFRIVLLAVAVCFFLIGMNRGEQEITFMKAIFICLECIGIG